MLNLLTAIMTKITTGPSNLFNDVGGRVFRGIAPSGVEYPYVIFTPSGGALNPTFSEDIRRRRIQFSFYSISDSIVEIAGMESDCEVLFHEQDITITGEKQAWAEKIGDPTELIENETTTEGTQVIRSWHVDYDFITSKN